MNDTDKLIFTKISVLSLVSFTIVVVTSICILLFLRWADTMDSIDEYNQAMLDECPDERLVICVESDDGDYVGENYVMFLKDEGRSELLGFGTLFTVFILLSFVDCLLVYDLKKYLDQDKSFMIKNTKEGEE